MAIVAALRVAPQLLLVLITGRAGSVNLMSSSLAYTAMSA